MATSTITRTRTKAGAREMKRAVNFQLAEYDRAGNLQARYVESLNEAKGLSRIDILVSLDILTSSHNEHKLVRMDFR